MHLYTLMFGNPNGTQWNVAPIHAIHWAGCQSHFQILCILLETLHVHIQTKIYHRVSFSIPSLWPKGWHGQHIALLSCFFLFCFFFFCFSIFLQYILKSFCVSSRKFYHSFYTCIVAQTWVSHYEISPLLMNGLFPLFYYQQSFNMSFHLSVDMAVW